ncbi:D-aminoacyl-tRNA deacylase [Lacticaseibacillus parakribbianus]|uniref:D-aminoacyl-tRNA deacylase n=1 Tax=Lacticaseibacillus parakribbianus TaxID=2970927 RepID=UPI0021CB51BB|nr:D-aminoacyl-tRNA deacylase [Lacticaseibacillus parakribbianus]
MKAVVQRVSQAQVTIDGEVCGRIDRGFVVLLGVGPNDTPADVDYLVAKISKLRVFSDPAGKMNLALAQVGGAVLAISQFTLYADTRKGNRPSFTAAAAPALGEQLYDLFVARMRATNLQVATGVFGADMQVSLINDGPVTILFDTEEQHVN